MKSRFDASVTVEASLIMPMLVFVIIALIFLNIFEYDRVRLCASLIVAGERITEKAKQAKGMPGEDEIGRILREGFAEGFLMCETFSGIAYSDRNTVKLNATVLMRFPETVMFTDVIRKLGHYENSLTIGYTDREKILRCVAAGEQIWDKVVKRDAD